VGRDTLAQFRVAVGDAQLLQNGVGAEGNQPARPS
jgi:hypothetical protein